VVRHDQVRVGGHAQAAEVDPAAAQLVDLGREHDGIHDHAVADRAQLAGVEDPRRDQVELERLALADDRVPGVVAALEADHEVGLLGEQVYDLPLPLVAPLGADDHQARHAEGSLGRGLRHAVPVEVRELRILRKEGQRHLADRPVSVLRDDEVRLAEPL
jgi:hypothetical protein